MAADEEDTKTSNSHDSPGNCNQVQRDIQNVLIFLLIKSPGAGTANASEVFSFINSTFTTVHGPLI